MLDLKKNSICVLLFILFAGLVSGQESGKENAPKVEAIFVVHSSFHDIETFTDFSEQIARLKPFGRIDMNINTTAKKG